MRPVRFRHCRKASPSRWKPASRTTRPSCRKSWICERVREYYSHKLKAAQRDETSQIQALQESFAIEMETRLKNHTAELQEKLDMREVELFYRHEQEKNLRDEIAHLRRENQALLSN